MGIEFDETSPTHPVRVTVVPIPGAPEGISWDELGGPEFKTPQILFEEVVGGSLTFLNAVGEVPTYSLASALDISLPWRRPGLMPDGSLEAGDRAAMLFLYGGV